MANNDREAQKSITELSKLGFIVKVIENLHSKAVIGETLMYQGSANITYSGLYRNRESITLTVVNNQDEVLRKLLG